MSRDIALYFMISYFLLYLLYLLLVWLLRYQYPLLYSSSNPHSRILKVGFYLLLINSYIVLHTANPLANRYHLFTHVAVISLIGCLLFLKSKQIYRSPRFEFMHFNEKDFQSFINFLDNEVKAKSPAIKKSDPLVKGFMDHYFFYEFNQTPFLYIEMDSVGLLTEINLEFYPTKEFNLLSIHQLMKTLYQSYGKNVRLPYERNRSIYLTLTISFIMLLYVAIMIQADFFPPNPNLYFYYIMILPIFFLLLDSLKKTSKKNFLNNQY